MNIYIYIYIYIYHINDFCHAISFCHVNLRNLSNWFNANKIMLNVTKTELVIFKAKHKKLDFEFKLTLNDKKVYKD